MSIVHARQALPKTEKTNLYELVVERSEKWPDAIAFGGQEGIGWKTLNGRQVRSGSDRLAVELHRRFGIRTGDRVVFWVPNSWRTPLYLFALWRLGAVVVPFDRDMNPDAAANIIQLVEAKAVIVGYPERPTWLAGALVVDWWDPNVSETLSSASADAWDVPNEELAAIFFTSGTTGQPKGCMITHANFLSQVRAIEDILPLDTTCRLASLLPLSHLFEQTVGLLYAFAQGASVHYIPSRRRSDILRVLSEQKVTHMIAVPQLLTHMGDAIDGELRKKLPGPAYRSLLSLADRLSLDARRLLFRSVHQKLGGDLRLIASGGAALPVETQRLWERFGVRIIQGYGASECSPVIAAGDPRGTTPYGSVGKPLRDVTIRLSDEGEILVRGPNVMRGYWKDESRTSEVLLDGWYATGDKGEIDPDGNLWIRGRVKELIVLASGQNVWPQDVEDALRQEVEVRDAAVLAVANGRGGDVLHAYLIPASPSARASDPKSIIARVNRRLAAHQRVASASWWEGEDFPRTALQKVRRHLLPPPGQKAETTVPLVDDPIGRAILARHSVPILRDDLTLAEIGFDSFGLADLIVDVEEQSGLRLPETKIGGETTIGELRAYLQDPAEDDASETVRQVPQWPFTWGKAFRALGVVPRLLFRVAASRVSVLGSEHLANLDSPLVIAGTHRSYADVFLLQHALRRSPSHAIAGKLILAASASRLDDAGSLSVLGTLALGLYPLQQHRNQRASMENLARLVAATRGGVVIFPSGHHVTTEQENAQDPKARFRTGVALLSHALDASVLPFGLAGTPDLLPANPPPGYRGMVIAGVPVMLKRSPVAIAFGPPLRRETHEEPAAFAARLQEVCYALRAEAEKALAR